MRGLKNHWSQNTDQDLSFSRNVQMPVFAVYMHPIISNPFAEHDQAAVWNASGNLRIFSAILPWLPKNCT